MWKTIETTGVGAGLNTSLIFFNLQIMLPQFIVLAINQVAEELVLAEKMKQQAIERYNKALTLPRKKKKREKKIAQLDYAIACWSPFGEIF